MPRKNHLITLIILACLALLLIVGCGPSEERAAEPQGEDNATQAVIAWIEENAIALTSTEMTEDTSDLVWLHKAVGDAAIVGLGDQTNGTVEFLTMKNRITAFLLDELGFSLVATTSSWGPSLTADRFVSEGKGRLRSARDAQEYPFSGSVTFKEIITWLQRYQLHHAETSLHFVGLNPLSPHSGYSWCKNVLLTAGHALSQLALRNMERLERSYAKTWRDQEARSQYFALAESVNQEILEAMSQVDSRLSSVERSILRRMPRAVEQFKEYLDISDNAGETDASGWNQSLFDFYNHCMAENLQWWQSILGEDTRVVVWGHNSQIANRLNGTRLQTLGQHLQLQTGEGYVSIGFSTGEGIVYAPVYQEDVYLGLGLLLIPAPMENSYESVFSSVSFADFALELKTLTPNSEAAAWMNEPRPFKLLGARFTQYTRLEEAYETLQSLPEMFDYIIHLQFTTGIQTVY